LSGTAIAVTLPTMKANTSDRRFLSVRVFSDIRRIAALSCACEFCPVIFHKGERAGGNGIHV